MPIEKRVRQPAKPAPPLDPRMLEAIALRYVERFQTTRARLIRLLRQKLRQRGWVEDGLPPDPEAVADRMVELGYISDVAFAQARARGLQRRGLGAGRVRASLAAHGVGEEDAEDALASFEPVQAALDFARRKRLGPYGPPVADPRIRQRQFAAMARAGHAPRLARAILHAATVEEAQSMRDDEGA